MELSQKKKHWLVFSLSMNLVILGIFKYLPYLGSVLLNENEELLNKLNGIVLPIGISFYTFQTLSYTIDVYRNKIKAEKNFVDFAIFVTYFPQLVAGPIERYSDLSPKLKNIYGKKIKFNLDGLGLLAMGLIKKVLIADTVGFFVDEYFSNYIDRSSLYAWSAMFAYTLQIYCDFSGYTDMARGLSRMLGVELTLNFDAPYFSRNISEFWRRWHISLSSFLKDYIYIPLGGNRYDFKRMAINIFMTMVLGGIWHGANITFVIWGAFHGILIIIVKLFEKFLPFNIPKPASCIITFLSVVLGWVLFRSSDLFQMTYILKKMLLFDGKIDGVVLSWGMLFIFGIISVEAISLFNKKTNLFAKIESSFLNTVYVLIIITCYMQSALMVDKPFIYFQF
jgi:alginate O-acetyltransferase complex protein AlgI